MMSEYDEQYEAFVCPPGHVAITVIRMEDEQGNTEMLPAGDFKEMLQQVKQLKRTLGAEGINQYWDSAISMMHEYADKEPGDIASNDRGALSLFVLTALELHHDKKVRKSVVGEVRDQIKRRGGVHITAALHKKRAIVWMVKETARLAA